MISVVQYIDQVGVERMYILAHIQQISVMQVSSKG